MSQPEPPPRKVYPDMNRTFKEGLAESIIEHPVALLVTGLIVVVIALSICSNSGSGGGGSPRTSPPDQGEAVGAWVVCQQFLEDRLVAPSTAEYPSGYSDYTRSLGGGRFRVDAYVDAQNSFGAMIRTDFSCTVDYQGNDNWRLEELTIEE